LPEITVVPDLAASHATRPTRLFGWPTQACALPDAEGLGLGGPERSPPSWLWGVYGGPNTLRRRQALGLLDAVALAAWRERARARGSFSGYLGVRTRAGFYLLAQDVDGPYLTGYREADTVDPMPSRPPRFVYQQLVRAARWLRQGAAPPRRLSSNAATS
jgi:hypothetical protein